MEIRLSSYIVYHRFHDITVKCKEYNDHPFKQKRTMLSSPAIGGVKVLYLLKLIKTCKLLASLLS